MRAEDRSYHRRQLDSAVVTAEALSEKITLAIEELKQDDEDGTAAPREALAGAVTNLAAVSAALEAARRYVARRPEPVS